MTVAELIGSATVRIERVTRSIRREEMDKLESAGIPGDIRWLREEYATLDDALRGSCCFIRDEWPAIQGNRGRLYELRLLEDSFSRFTSTVTGFDDAVTADEHSAEKLLGEYEASREYAILAAQYADLLQPAFSYEHSLRVTPAEKFTPLQGLCADMQAYFEGLTDRDLEDVLYHHTLGAHKGTWKGTLTQATYFGKHFKTTAQVMNRLFHFYGEDHLPRQAHFTKYPADKISEQDPLAIILSNYPHQK